MIEPKFVNRNDELKALERLGRRGSPSVMYVYGPEGCGKTRLLREFIKTFDGIGIYIDALEQESVKRALIFTQRLSEVEDLFTELAEQVVGSVGKWFTSRIFTILEKLTTKIKIKGENLVIAVDDVVRARGLEDLERYIKWLYELQWKVYEDYEPKSVLIVATTSEGYSLRRIMRHTYNIPNLIWNLRRGAYEELVQQLGLANKDVIEDVWKLTGGNPRSVIEVATIYRWNYKEWLARIENELRDVANILRAKNLVEETYRLIENPDILHERPSIELRETYETLLEHNVMMYVGIDLLSSWVRGERTLEPNRELGIGRYYAWQMPAYRKALERALQE